ncbi:hypothetical protein [Sphaerisporangium rhizosphaerae]|uniref:Uncharacterized protein n=1 Tax=Sphaerisporangium rhizosphaerae TaxID=2269375 RepID=A0ABW2NZI8_9ACTN
MTKAGKTIRFSTIGGNFVTFTPDPTSCHGYGSWKCLGCEESGMRGTRGEANKHAERCRAL